MRWGLVEGRPMGCGNIGEDRSWWYAMMSDSHVDHWSVEMDRSYLKMSSARASSLFSERIGTFEIVCLNLKLDRSQEMRDRN